jgi:hypothetical protein
MCGAGSEEVFGHSSFSSRKDHLLLLQRPSYSLPTGVAGTGVLVSGLPGCWHHCAVWGWCQLLGSLAEGGLPAALSTAPRSAAWCAGETEVS